MSRDEEMIEVAPVLSGLYAVTLWVGEGAGKGPVRVPGTEEDRERWTAARRRFEEDAAYAAAVWKAPVSWWRRVRWLPGYRAEQRRRRAEYTARWARAEERYRAVHEEIRARADAVRQEQERAERAARERHDRLASVAHRSVWGWVRKGQKVAVVFRHDAGDGRLRADSSARGPSPLAVVGDELYEYGITRVRWDDAAKKAVAADCAAAGHPLTFAEWWAEFGPWEKPHQGPSAWSTNRPRWPVPTRRSRERLARGTSHHSSHGVGDYGGFGGF
ncbi:MAG TPA: hypothetical protein VHJ17_23710 [Thermomonospora sp.]|nr:hypothetical protein [Thermomonospora sp.]